MRIALLCMSISFVVMIATKMNKYNFIQNESSHSTSNSKVPNQDHNNLINNNYLLYNNLILSGIIINKLNQIAGINEDHSIPVGKNETFEFQILKYETKLTSKFLKNNYWH